MVTGPNMSGKSALLRQTALISLDGASWVLRPGQIRRPRHPRPHLHTGRRLRQHQQWRVHVHGGNERDGGHLEQPHLSKFGPVGRDWTGHEHLRRSQHRVGDCRAPARVRILAATHPVRHPLPRAQRHEPALFTDCERQRERQGNGRQNRVPSQACAWRFQPQFWHSRGPAGRDASRPGAPRRRSADHAGGCARRTTDGDHARRVQRRRSRGGHSNEFLPA